MKYNRILICFIFPCILWSQKSGKLELNSKVDSLINLGKDLQEKKKLDSAYEYFYAADSLASKEFGQESKDYITACYYRAQIEFKLRHFDVAQKYYSMVISLLRKYNDLSSEFYANSLSDLAKINADKGAFSEAKKMILEEISWRDVRYGKVNEKSATSYFNLGIISARSEHYTEAENYFQNSLLLREKLNGVESLPYSNVLYNLGKLYSATNLMVKAKNILAINIEILKKLKKDKTIPYVGSVVELAYVELQQSEYRKAEKLLLEAMDLFLKNPNLQQNNLYGWSLVTIATYYRDVGQYNKALEYYSRALSVMEMYSDKSSWDYYSVLRNIGRIYLDIGDYNSARATLESIISSKELSKEAIEINMPYVLEVLYSLYLEIGIEIQEPDMASLYEALKNKSTYSRIVAHTLYGKWHSNHNNSTKALQEFNVAFQLAKDSLDNANLLTIELPSLLCREYSKLNYQDSSLKYFNIVYNLRKLNMLESVNFMTEQELVFHMEKLNNYLFNNCVINQFNSKDIACFLYNDILFYRGFMLKARLIRDNAFRKDTINQELLESFRNSKRRLAIEYSKHQLSLDTLKILSESSDKLEKELYDKFENLKLSFNEMTWKDVQNALKTDEAAIEIIRYSKKDFRSLKDSFYYVALVITKKLIFPKLIPLCSEVDLEKICGGDNARKLEHVTRIYSNSRKVTRPGVDQTNLFDMIIQPMLKDLENIHTIYYAPVGLLHQINLEAISSGPKKLLLDDYKIHLLSSTRDIVVGRTSLSNDLDEYSLFGGIFYNIDSSKTFTSDSTNDALVNWSTRGGHSFYNNEPKHSISKWKDLPGTKREIDQIRSILESNEKKVVYFSAYLGTEESFKKLGRTNLRKQSPTTIHIASHAFFFNASSDSIKENSSSGYYNGEKFSHATDPMIRSGLVLAGANYAWTNGHPIHHEFDDGILTSYEISLLDLQNTELVVLSACETGLGEVRSEEGVYGLQRAFKIAGVHNILMSLWQVPDKQTSQLMELFYFNWITKKMSLKDSLHHAQNTMRKSGLEAYYWAGFVLME